MKISKKIIDIRNENNLTQEELADILCVTRQTISNWENSRCYPDIETLNIISDKFNIPLDYLIKDDKELLKDMSQKIKGHKTNKIVIIALLISMSIMVCLSYKIYLVCYYNNGFNKEIFVNFVDKLEKIDVSIDKGRANQKIDKLNIYIPEEFYEIAPGKYGNYSIIDNYIHIKVIKSNYPVLDENAIYFKNINYNDLLSRKNINNTIDLLDYIHQNNNGKMTILNNKSDIQLNYLLEHFMVNDLKNGSFYKYYYFDKNLVGKMIHRSNNYEIELYDENNTYQIIIKSPFIELDDVMHILESAYFD